MYSSLNRFAPLSPYFAMSEAVGLAGSWSQNTVLIHGTSLFWGGQKYSLSDIKEACFCISGDYGGGSATFTSDSITWANGVVFNRDPTHLGIGLPPTQGASNSGAFLPGVSKWDYTPDNIGDIVQHGLNAIRLCLNTTTAQNEDSLAKFQQYFDKIDGRGLICMFGSIEHGDAHGDGHGTGLVDDSVEIIAAWKSVHKAFKGYPNVLYEIFNEPFGYKDAKIYVEAMKGIICAAELPMEKCILAGTGYSSNVQDVANNGWDGLLAYHFYPSWLPDGQRTQENFSNLISQALSGLSTRVHVTEFGANLEAEDYNSYRPGGTDENLDSNVNTLRGLHDAVIAFVAKGVPLAGMYHWHGWHNSDCYDFWNDACHHGAQKVKDIMRDAGSFGLARSWTI